MAQHVQAVQKAAISPEQRQILRHKAQTDLYFLAKEILGYADLVPHVHQQICDTYVKKDPSKSITDQSETKTRMVLAPRGIFKTTIDLSDIVQWILCFPNIRILLLTGTQDLAWRMVREVKSHFLSNDYLRELFPECCPPKNSKWGTDDEFVCPARTKSYREPTLSSSTLDSVKAGVHVDVLAIDDAVNEVNSTTIAQCFKTIEAFDALTYVLEPGGYVVLNGTRYKPYDLYGRQLQRNEELLARIAEQDPDDADTEVVALKYTILPVWKVKEGRILMKDANGLAIIKKDDVDLLFPERLKFRALYKQYRDNPAAFACQMLNDPLLVEGAERPFTDQLIQAHTIPHTQMPHPASCRDYIMWDLSGAKPGQDTDFSVGAVGRLSTDGKLYIIDLVRGRWNPTQLAAQIVTLARNYPTAASTWIEDSVGARYLEPTINGIAAQCAMNVRVNWVKIPRYGGAKRYRIDSLAQFFKGDRLWLASYLPHLDTLKSELLDRNPAHDDCSDAIALLVKELQIAASADGLTEVPSISKKEIANRIFEAAIFGEDDTYVSDYKPLTPETPSRTYESGILGYGFAP